MAGPRLVDLSHAVHDGMPAYPGLPAARVRPVLSHDASRERYDGEAEFCLTEVAFASNTGTYLDSPWHRFRGRADVAAIPLERVAALPALVVDGAVSEAGVEIPDLGEAAGAAVLIRTGWDRHWGTDRYFAGGPFLASGAVDRLLRARPSLVGVDFANVDDTGDPARPAHTRLLDADVLVVEHLTRLTGLPATGARFHGAPLAVRGAASMPIRAYAELPHAAVRRQGEVAVR